MNFRNDQPCEAFTAADIEAACRRVLTEPQVVAPHVVIVPPDYPPLKTELEEQ